MSALLLIALMSGQAPAPGPRPPERPESGCALVTESGGRVGRPRGVPLRVLGGPERLALVLPPGERLRAVLCRRAAIVPAAGDDRVLLQLRVPLNLSSGARRGVLEHNGRSYVFRQIAGPAISAAERQAVAARLGAFNRAPR